jgi:hypothetical protein
MEAKLKVFNVIGHGLWVIGNGGRTYDLSPINYDP